MFGPLHSTAVRIVWLFLALSPMAATAQTAEPLPPTEEGGVLEPRRFDVQRADAILLDAVIRPNAPWLQLAVAGAIYDARRDVFIGHWSPSVQAGYRFDRLGVFGMFEFDHTLDFTLETKSLLVLNLGVGLEYLNFLGHVRTSISAGLTVLAADTAVDEAGELGWFVDFRPGGLRWAVGESQAFELTPLSLDILVPVTDGIPLVVFSYMTLISWEWSL